MLEDYSTIRKRLLELPARLDPSLESDVLFNNGTGKRISGDQLSLYVMEKQNPKNVKDVKIVQIRHPSTYLMSGVRIIDTPGVASVHDHNTETTYSYLPQADAAIFMVSVDPPISAAEYHFLNDLKGFAARLFFVQNKIDMVNAAESVESLEFTRRVIEDQIGIKDVNIFPLSAKNALEGKLRGDLGMIEDSGLPAFERMMGDFLVEEKGKVLLDSATNKIRNIMARESFSAKLMQKSLKDPLKDLEHKIAGFADAEAEIAQERRDSGHLVRAEANALTTEVLIPDLEALKREKTLALVKSVGEHYNALGRMSNRELAYEFNRFVHQQIHEIFDDFLPREERALREKLEVILARLVSRTNKIITRLVTISSSIFEIDVMPFVIDESLARESGFQFKIDEDVKVSLEYISESATFMLPGILAHKIILKGARTRMEDQVERHCGRLRHDFMERIEETVENFQRQLDDTVETTLEGIRRALDAGRQAHERSEYGVSREEARLADRLAVFESALQELDGLKYNPSILPRARRNS
ncbi:MAG: dynamin family protein [Thermoleophilia bacterium]